jgi:uncharacterized membrane protein
MSNPISSRNTEALVLTIILLPAIYLAFVWNTLPEEVPMHFNAKGEVDRYGSKDELIGVLFLLNLPLYFIMRFAPQIDPKKKINEKQLFGLRLVLHLFISAIALFIIYSTQQGALANPFGIVSLVGLLFAALGFFFRSIKPNYFIGIKTPWTLESEEVWNKTHRVSGPVWIAGGIFMALSPLFAKAASIYIILGVTFGLAIFSVVYSYVAFKNLRS